jgi:hypothetical protein
MLELSSCWALRSLPLCNMSEVIGNDPQTQPAFHPLLPVIGTFAPAIIASQTRNAALDACAPAIAAPEGSRVFQSLTFFGELARSWDRHPLDAHSEEAFLGVRRMHSTIPSDQVGRMLKERAVMLHHSDRLPMLLRVFEEVVLQKYERKKKAGRPSEEGSLCSDPEGLVKKLYLSENISFSDSLHLSLADHIHRLIPL